MHVTSIYRGLPMPEQRQSIREAFLTAMFSFLGYIAHCDGEINRDEINRLKTHMKKLNLSEAEQRRALQLFKSGTAAEFNASQALQKFRTTTTPKLIQILLVHLVTIARADGYLVEKELHALQWVAHEVGYKSIVFNHLLNMIYIQDQIARRRNPQQHTYQPAQPTAADTYSAPHNAHATTHTKARTTNHSATHNKEQASSHRNEQEKTQRKPNKQSNNQSPNLHKAYKILGVTADMTEDEIRRAYKKLASQLHPDKLLSQGLAQEHINAATERFKQVQMAYAFIKKHRTIYTAS